MDADGGLTVAAGQIPVSELEEFAAAHPDATVAEFLAARGPVVEVYAQPATASGRSPVPGDED